MKGKAMEGWIIARPDVDFFIWPAASLPPLSSHQGPSFGPSFLPLLVIPFLQQTTLSRFLAPLLPGFLDSLFPSYLPSFLASCFSYFFPILPFLVGSLPPSFLLFSPLSIFPFFPVLPLLISFFHLQAGARVVVLASDGLWDVISGQGVADILWQTHRKRQQDREHQEQQQKNHHEGNHGEQCGGYYFSDADMASAADLMAASASALDSTDDISVVAVCF
jgi:hypothetical protein